MEKALSAATADNNLEDMNAFGSCFGMPNYHLPSDPILVTGGAGFIGSNFVGDWIGTVGSKIINLDKLTYAGNPDNLAELKQDPRHIFVQGDINDRALMSELFTAHKPWAVVHFAAESHVDRSILGPEEFVRTNVNGTFCVLEAAREYWRNLPADSRNHFRFLHVSTDEVYGSLGPADPAFCETTPYAPNSPYSASKAGSDHLVRAYHHTYGLPTLTTNCSNNYGPFQFPEKLIPLIIHNALHGRALPVYGDGMNVRDWLYVGDHCTAIRTVLGGGRPGETYCIGGKSEMKNLDVVETICSVLDELQPASPHRPHNKLIKFVTDRPGHDRRYAIDCRKLEKELGWQPRLSFAAGIAQTVRWYLEHTDWVNRVVSGEYRQWVNRNYAERS